MTKKLFYFNNYSPPCPSTYIGTTSTAVDSGRNIKSYVVGSVIREDIAAIDATFNYIKISEWSKLLKQFNSKYGGSFYRRITFFNQVTAAWETRTFYVADRSTTGLHQLDRNGMPVAWLGAKLSLVEK